MSRRCNIPPSGCRHRYSTPCCKDCKEANCAVRCLNDPKWCNCWEDKPPKRRRGHKVDALLVAALHGKGLSGREIARWVGCCEKTVRGILQELGV